MRLLSVDTLEQARKKLLDKYQVRNNETIEVSLENALGKVLAKEIKAPMNVPSFRRSMVDGYAVCAKDIQAASESVPTFLTIIGEVTMGKEASQGIKSGECIYVPTGGMIPPGADAMVMVEYCESFAEDSIAVYASAAKGDYIILEGEDIKTGEIVLESGTYLSANAIGVIASMGIATCKIYNPYKIAIISTGDEISSLNEKIKPGQIYDINSYVIKGKAKEEGFDVTETHVVRDDEELLRMTVKNAMRENDFVVVSGGSSQGKKDVTAKIFEEITESEVLTHGLALKPGKPTITAYDNHTKTILVGLPGHPVAAAVVFDLLVVWLKNQWTGEKEKPLIIAKMEHNVPAADGKTTCLFISLNYSPMQGYIAVPIYGKSGLMTTMTQANGYVMIEKNKEGLKAGEEVLVHLF